MNSEQPHINVVSEEDNFISPEDREILEIAKRLRVRIKIVGCGGGGSNTIKEGL